MPDAVIPVFKTITLGLHASPEEYRKALKAHKCRMSDLDGQVLDKIEMAPQPVALHLVALSAAELGFRTPVCYKVIRARVEEMGLELCQAEAGPALRLQYLDQPKSNDDRLIVGTVPVFHAGGEFIFDLLNIPGPRWMGRGLWLSACGIDTATLGDKVFGPGARFVFASSQLRD